MITLLHIENYALIRQSDIHFDKGFVAITGETGAGKSVMLGALGLLLGQRADTQVLADKERKCVVEATFDIKNLDVRSFFEENDIDYDDQLILRREILPSAKSRAFINDTPASLQQMKSLGQLLVDIHSQHETLNLADGTFQTSLLDLLEPNGSVSLQEYRQSYQEYAKLKKTLEQDVAEDAQNKRDFDYLKFQYDELQQAQLIEGEQEALEQEAELMSHTENIKEVLAVVKAMNGSDGDALQQLMQSKSMLSRISSYHQDIEEYYRRIESVYIELQDILSEVEHFDDSLQYSIERQQVVNSRLDLIYRLEKKHDVDSVALLLAKMSSLEDTLGKIDSIDEKIRITMEAVDKAFDQMQTLATRQTQLRQTASTLLEQQILPILAMLGMKDARLKVEIVPSESYGPMGNDKVRFLFNANKGGEFRELGKVVSGGEMSRLMLAIKSMLTKNTLLPTIIFDEIDTGVSGDISMAVGGIMCQMSQYMQVIAITHLPQIAAKATTQLKVYKSLCDDGATHSQVRQLNHEERVQEIAVMLSADPPTSAALQTARELMKL